MLRTKQRPPYRPSAHRLETRDIQINKIEARGGLNPPVVSMVGPWNARSWYERNLFVGEALDVRNRLIDLFPLEDFPPRRQTDGFQQ